MVVEAEYFPVLAVVAVTLQHNQALERLVEQVVQVMEVAHIQETVVTVRLVVQVALAVVAGVLQEVAVALVKQEEQVALAVQLLQAHQER